MKHKQKIEKRKKLKLPRIYLDTVIIRKLIEKRPANLVNLMRTIKDRKWKCFTSALGILELCNLKKDDVYLNNKVREGAEFKEIIREREQKRLEKNDLKLVRKYLDSLKKKYPYFSAYQIPPEVWIDAYKTTINSNINSIDAVHLASAFHLDANVLITSDGHFIEEANNLLKEIKQDNRIRLVTPEKIFDILEELGFKLE